MINIGYAWKNGAQVKIDANIAGKELERLQDADGIITTMAIVEASKVTTAPLHEHFEWDNEIAAENYRDDQARYILRSIVPLYADLDTEEEVQGDRLYISMQSIGSPDRNGRKAGRYMIVTSLPPDPKRPPDRQMQAWTELQAWRDRYGDDPFFAPIIAAIEQMTE